LFVKKEALVCSSFLSFLFSFSIFTLILYIEFSICQYPF
jgi:hypothetical protein